MSRMKLKLRFYPSTEPKLRRTLRLFAAGSAISILVAIITFIYLNISSEKKSYSAAPAANLSQARNGTDPSPTSPVNWVNGNLSGTQAHYIEGMSVPYQCVMTDLTIGAQVTITIGYEIKNSNKHAFDYLTHYSRILPHGFPLHSTPEIIDPLIGTGLGGGTPFTTYTIPIPSTAGTPVAGQPTNSYNALTGGERLMTLFNGTLDTIYYLAQGSLTDNQSETQIIVKFTPGGTTAVLAWGGHIASRNDWGYSGGPRSAGGISGSPFHLRLINWSYGSLGSQDRSLAGGSVLPPPSGPLPVTLISFTASPVPNGIELNWSTATELNNDYFTLEHSVDGMQYSIVDNIDGAGNSNEVINYSYMDENPLPGTSYYRLTQTDFDGTEKIFSSISINNDGTSFALSVVNVYPNPFTGYFSITYNCDSKCTTLLEVRNSEGKLIFTEPLPSSPGMNHFDFNRNTKLPNGIYFVALSQGKNKTEARRIIKY